MYIYVHKYTYIHATPRRAKVVREFVLYHFGKYCGRRLFKNVKVQSCPLYGSKLLKYNLPRIIFQNVKVQSSVSIHGVTARV